MKTAIHPKYYDNAAITCSCGNVIHAGSTGEGLRTELCSACHPFYTGHKKLVDTAGRVDRFEARRKAAELHQQALREKKMAGAIKKEVEKQPAAKKKASPRKTATKNAAAPKAVEKKTGKKAAKK